jgi:hypothetical protein
MPGREIDGSLKRFERRAVVAGPSLSALLIVGLTAWLAVL